MMKKILLVSCLLSFQLFFQTSLQLYAAELDSQYNRQTNQTNNQYRLIAENLESAETEIIELITPELDFNINRETYDNPLVQIETSLGNVILELFPREAPETVANFLDLAHSKKEFTDPATGLLVKRPFYDGLVFHRVINSFMIQGGSPTGRGDGGPGYSFHDEINARSLGLDKMQVIQEDGYPHPLLGIRSQSDFQQGVLAPLYQKMGITGDIELEANIDAVNTALRSMTVKQSYENLGYQYTETVISRNLLRGVIAMANSGPDSNGSQFFITLVDTDWLTGKHTVFGKVRAGMDVLDTIGRTPVDGQSRPLQDVVIISIRQLQD